MGWLVYSNISSGLLDNTEDGRVHGFLVLGRGKRKPLMVSLDLDGNLEGRLHGTQVVVKQRRVRRPKGPRLADLRVQQTGCLLSGSEREGFLCLTWPYPDNEEQSDLTSMVIDSSRLHIVGTTVSPST